MELSATQKKLRRGLAIVSRAVGNASTLPILANILFETEKGRLRLSATDLEIGVTTWVGCKVETDGAVTIPARTVVDFVNSITDETLAFTTEGEAVKLASATFEAKIPGLAATEYPTIPTLESGSTLSIPIEHFSRSLKGCVAAAALDDARPALAGVALQIHDGQIFFAATDSFRLAEYVTPLKEETAEVSCIIPSRAVHELNRIIGQVEDVSQVMIVVTNNQISFTMGETQLVTRLIEASYPDYRKVIPTNFQSEVVVESTDILNALRVASIFTTAQANNVHLVVDEQTVQLKSVASSYGQQQSSIPAEVMHHGDDKKLDVVFNARYLQDAVNAAAGKKVILKLSGVVTPAVITNPDLPEYRHIVMPIRVQG